MQHKTINFNEAHLWLVDLDAEIRTRRDALEKLLSQDECERSCQFAFPYLKDNFVAARANLRLILSDYIEVPSKEIQFKYTKHGKPQLVDNNNCITFNLSHSKNWAAYVVSFGNDVGIDIEKVRKDRYSSHMDQLCLSEKEQKFLHGLSFAERLQAFYLLWTCKEALVKALGYGLAYPFKELEIDIRNKACPKIKVNDIILKDWMLHPFHALNGFKGAIATKKGVNRVFLKDHKKLLYGN